MKYTKGLFTDYSPQDQPSGTYRHAKNIVLTNTKKGVENETGFTSLGELAPYDIIGFQSIEESIIVFSTNNTNSEIGIITNSLYSTIYNDNALNFNTSNPIQIAYYKNYKSERIVAWIDDLNSPKIINLDGPTVTDVNELEVFPIFDTIAPTYNLLDSGGSLLSGTYQFSYRYTSEDGTKTGWIKPGKPIYINDDSSAVGFNEYDGIKAGSVTSKSIEISIPGGGDTRFNFIEVSVISTIDDITTSKVVKRLPITGLTITTVYSGSEELEEITLDEILVNSSSYNNAKAITSLNNRLFLGNLSSEEDINFQPYANDILINYTTETASFALSAQSSKFGDVSPGFQHGEVYAFYIVFELNNGSYSRAFHIPGRPSLTSEIVLSQYRTGGTLDQGLPSSALVYQVEDTANNGSATTNMGYWENINERYPQTADFDGSIAGPNLGSQRVRHHRFPSIREMRTESGFSAYGVSFLYRLGINVSNVNLPSEIQEKVKSWQIFYAKRDYANSTVVGQSLFNYGAVHHDNPLVGGGGVPGPLQDGFLSSGGNWNLTGAGTHPTLVHTDTIRFDDIDLLLRQPSIAPTYISNQVELSLPIGASGIYAPGSGMSTGYYEAGGGFARYLLGNYFLNATGSDVANTSFLRSISNGQYVLNNTISGQWNNLLCNDTYVAEISNGDTLSIEPDAVDNVTNIFPSATLRDVTYLTCLQQYKTDVYLGFTNQQLVATDIKRTDVDTLPNPTNLNDIFGGDTFTNLYSLLTTAPPDSEAQTAVTTPDLGFKAIKYFIGETRNNVGLRHEIPGSNQSLYLPKTDDLITFGEIFDIRESQNIGYNTDYSKLNDLNAITIYDTFINFESVFPHTIIFSDVQQTEEREISWKNFPVNNRYVMPTNRGVITNLQGIGNEDLLIHHENTLFKTKTNRSLQTQDGENVIVGSSNIFSIPPIEILIDGDGFAGTQHSLSCNLTKAGYLFVDDKQGKVFLYNNKLEEISSYGQRNFFRDFTKDVTDNNPYTNEGYTTVFDEDLNRILVTKKRGASSFTISYNPLEKHWISFHSYIPDFYTTTVNTNVYSINDNTIYQHGIGNKGLYYEVAPFSSFIDIVGNEGPNITKVLSSVDWINDSYSSSGIFDNNDTFDYITIRNNINCSGRIELEKAINLSTFYNLRKEERTWNFNKFRDVAINTNFINSFYNDFEILLSGINTNLDWFNKKRFINKYFIVRLEYLNTTNNLVSLLDFNFNYRKSHR